MRKHGLLTLFFLLLCPTFLLAKEPPGWGKLTEAEIRTIYRSLRSNPTGFPQLRQEMEEAVSSAQRLERIDLIAEGSQLLADWYMQGQQGPQDIRRAVNYYLTAIHAYEKLGRPQRIAESHYRVALGFMQFGDQPEALQHLLRALGLFDMLRDSSGMLRSQTKLAEVFMQTETYEEASHFAQRAETLARELGEDSALLINLIGLGRIHQHQLRLQQAETYFLQAQRLAQRLDQSALLAYVSSLLGDVNLYQGRTVQALALHQQALALARQQELTVERAQALLGLARVYRAQQQLQRAQAHLDSCLQLGAARLPANLLLAIYQELADLSLTEEKIDIFRTYQTQIDHLRDSLQEGARQELIQRLNAQFEKERRDLLIEKMKQEEALKDEEIRKQRTQVQFVVVIGLLLFTLALVLYQQYRAKQRSNQRLESLVSRRTQELQVANANLKDLNQELDMFAYRTTHDIRGPLARLMGLCQLALAEKNDAQVRSYVALLHREALNMDMMLHRFLQVNNIKHQRMHIEPVKLNDLVEQVCADLDEVVLPLQATIEVKVASDLEVITDQALLSIMVKNILENGLRYARADAEPHPYVHISAHRQADHLHLSIRDNGIGLDPTLAERVFEMFFRGTTHSIGLGLGLYATRLAAQKLGAKVRLETQNHEETEFVITLPLEIREPGGPSVSWQPGE